MRGTRHSWNTPIWRNTNERTVGNLNVKREHDKRIPHYRMPINPEEPESYCIPSNVPAFLVKLWKLVEDPQYEMHISWNRNGTGFIVHDQATFAREILPKYFKHNNFASFVRQLNMYGFRKVIGAEQGGLRSERDEWEFHNSNFQRSKPQLLEHVKRKAAPEDKKMKTDDVIKVFSEVQEMKGKQDDMTAKLDMMKRENETLWRELIDLRQKHQKQQQVVNKLVYFFMRLMNQNEKLNNRKRLMLEDSVTVAEQQAKRARQEYGESSSIPAGNQPPPYTIQPPSTQTVTISDISNSPNGMSASMQSPSSGPLITALSDDDDGRSNMSSSRPVVILPETSNITSKPIVTSPLSSTSSKTYPHAAVIQPTSSTTTGVVTFPDEQPPHVSVSQPHHVIEPVHYQDANQLMGVQRVRPTRIYGQEDQGTYDRNSQLDEIKYLSAQRNQLNEQIDFIGANLESIQHVLANQQSVFDPLTLNELFNPETNNAAVPPQDILDSLADRAASPIPSMAAQQLVQYNPNTMQATGSPRQAMASSRARHQLGVGRKTMEWPGLPEQFEEEDNDQRLRSGYDVQDLFNG